HDSNQVNRNYPIPVSQNSRAYFRPSKKTIWKKGKSIDETSTRGTASFSNSENTHPSFDHQKHAGDNRHYNPGQTTHRPGNPATHETL
ncbi:hypothetical protein, partial [Neobacillus drentensis]|uniref:hypothetical protein n=1 Tax=Neobacillus drentensis TaxID=220684 RepID=UPI002FFE5645